MIRTYDKGVDILLKRLVFALIIFIMLLTIPNISLSFLENKLNYNNDGALLEKNDIIIKNTNNTINNEPEQKLIKVYNLSTNDVMVVDYEEYLKGVIASEMPAEFNTEALKAQAITARTYMLFRLKKYPNGQEEHKDAPLCTGIHCQVWKSEENLIELHGVDWYEKYWNKFENAVESTRGQILTYEGKIIEPLFHSTSGGRTENSEDVFSTAIPYLRSVESPYEDNSPRLHGTVKMNTTEFINKIKSKYGDISINSKNLNSKIKLGDVSEGGKVKTVFIDDKEISGREIRSLFNLNSTNFSFIQNDNIIEIVTTGYGHGVGMSQWGAAGMADNGYTYKEILKHYYEGVEIVKMK